MDPDFCLLPQNTILIIISIPGSLCNYRFPRTSKAHSNVRSTIDPHLTMKMVLLQSIRQRKPGKQMNIHWWIYFEPNYFFLLEPIKMNVKKEWVGKYIDLNDKNLQSAKFSNSLVSKECSIIICLTLLI